MPTALTTAGLSLCNSPMKNKQVHFIKLAKVLTSALLVMHTSFHLSFFSSLISHQRRVGMTFSLFLQKAQHLIVKKKKQLWTKFRITYLNKECFRSQMFSVQSKAMWVASFYRLPAAQWRAPEWVQLVPSLGCGVVVNWLLVFRCLG